MLLVLIRRELTSRNFAHIIHIKKNKKNISMEQFLFHKIGINAKLKYLILYQVSSKELSDGSFFKQDCSGTTCCNGDFFSFIWARFFNKVSVRILFPTKKMEKCFSLTFQFLFLLALTFPFGLACGDRVLPRGDQSSFVVLKSTTGFPFLTNRQYELRVSV